jgi:hypothetical protein
MTLRSPKESGKEEIMEYEKYQKYIDCVSSPPGHREYHIGCTEGSKWEARCVQEVLPAILDHLEQPSATKEDGIQAIEALRKAHEHPSVGSESTFKKYTWKIIDKGIDLAGNTVLDILCEMVLYNINSHFDWDRAVQTLIEKEYKAVAVFVITGVMQRYRNRQLVNHIREKEFQIAIKAIHVFEWNEKARIIEFLETEDKQLKKTIIESLASYGNKDDLPLLKKRLGNLFRKPEKDDFVRSRLKRAIEEIKMRERT